MGAFSRTYIAAGAHLYSDRLVNQALATGASLTWDVETSGSDWLVVQGDLTGAAIGDLAITVQPYEEDNVTLSSVVLTPPVAPPANILSGGHVYAYAKFDVVGLGRVRIFFKNNNAGAQTLSRGSWRCTGY